MYFHEMAEELRVYMAPPERGGNFVVQLVGDTLRNPMTDEEEKMAIDAKLKPLASGMSLNMQDQIYEGKKFISENRAGLIVADMMEQIFLKELIISMMLTKTIFKHFWLEKVLQLK